jgi:hypothetical protein
MVKKVATIILFTSILIGCNLQNNDITKDNNNSYGNANFSLNLSRVISLGYNITNVHAKLTHKIVGTIKESDLIIDSSSNTANKLISGLRIGIWDLIITISENNEIIGSGSTTIEIKSGVTTQANVTILLNTGSVQLNVNWIDTSITRDGLVAEWLFNGDANDTSGNGNNGTVYGASLDQDRFGNYNSSYRFNGIDNSIRVEDKRSLDLINGFTISAWIKSSDPNGGKSIVAKHNWNSGGNGYILKEYNGSDKLSIGILPYTELPSNSSTTSGVWIFVTATYDLNTLKIYKNNVLENSLNLSNNVIANNDYLVIGAISFSGAYGYENFNGIIDNLRIYSRVLSAEEITSLYLEN